jgi:hypothetical protein
MEKEEDINLESINKLIQSNDFQSFVTHLTNQFQKIQMGGYHNKQFTKKRKQQTQRKKNKHKQRKTHKQRNFIQYGGSKNALEIIKKSIIIIIFISLFLPFYLVPQLYNIIFTSTGQQLSEYIFEPFSLLFPSQLQNTIGATLVTSTIAYTEKSIIKNYNDIANGGVLGLNGLYALYLNALKLFDYFNKTQPNNNDDNKMKEKEMFYKNLDKVANNIAMNKHQQIDIPNGSKLLIPNDFT